MKSVYLLFFVLAILSCTCESSIVDCGHGLKRRGLPRIEQGPCPVNTTALNGTSIFCGKLVVEERSKIYKDRTIKLPLLRICPKNRHGLSNRSSPIVFLHGGPGPSELNNFNSMEKSFYFNIATRSGRDLILFDQRGTPNTKPKLTCSEVDPVTDKCVWELINRKVDLTVYNSRDSAIDVDDLRKSVRAKKINLYGNSYGTTLSQMYARAFKRHVRSIVLTGAIWPSFDVFLANSPKAFELVVGRQIFDCKRDFNCSRKYPNLQSDFDSLLDLPLEKKSRQESLPSILSTTRNAVLTYLRLLIRLNAGENLAYLPLHITSYAEFVRNPNKNSTAAATLTTLNKVASDIYKDFDEGGVITNTLVNCYDRQALYSEIVDESVNGGLKSREAWFKWPTPVELRTVCKRLPTLDPPISPAFPRHDIPTLILSGTYDLATPTEASITISNSLRNSSLIKIPGGGHGPLAESDCAVDNYMQFLQSPKGKFFKPLPCVQKLKANFV